jgi:predicted transposase YbfD/YdcC
MEPLVIEKPRIASLLQHFSAIADFRERWRVAHPLPEVLLLVVCGTIAAGDDYDEIVDWGNAHLPLLRRFLPYDWGIPCADWLRTLMNRIDPDLFSACFMSWACELRPDAPAHIALDGKTSRRSHDRKNGRKPLHLVSAFATNERLVLGQEAVAEKANELEAIPAVLDRLAASGALDGAVVTIDAIACNPKIAATIIEGGADYLLSVKDNQPSLNAEIAAFFADARASEIDRAVDLDKGHGRLEARRCVVSTSVDWLAGERRFPGEWRFPELAADRGRGRSQRPPLSRDALLHRFPAALGRAPARHRARPLAHRELAALGARRDLQGGSVAPAQGSRRPQHGGRAPLRPQPRAQRRRQALH